MFKVGHKVWSARAGWGKVVSVNEDSPYPIECEFAEGNVEFTADGREFENDARTLFFDEVVAQAAALYPPVEYATFRPGDIVLTTHRTLHCVVEFSDSYKNTVCLLDRAPKHLEDHFDAVSVYKEYIEKIVGNINDSVSNINDE